MLKIEHPDWFNFRIYMTTIWETMSEIVHTGLDIAGMIPVIGEVADLANGIIYVLEGDGVNATLSFAATIPVVGWGATTAKYAKKTIFALDGSKRTLNWFKTTTGTIDFGNRNLLRKVIGLSKNDPRGAHHIIPWESSTHPVIQRIAQGKDAFHLNERYNGIALSTLQHNGNHAVYRSRVTAVLDHIHSQNLSDDDAFRAVKDLIDRITNAINNNPNVPIDQIIF